MTFVVGYHMARVSPETASKALAAFRSVLNPNGGTRVARAFEAARVKLAA